MRGRNASQTLALTADDAHSLHHRSWLIPHSGSSRCLSGNNLIENDVVLLPSRPKEYGTEAELLAESQAFIHRYVDLSPGFERLASCYVLFTWLYDDAMNELTYDFPHPALFDSSRCAIIEK